MTQTTIADFEFAYPDVWQRYSEAINGFFAGTHSAQAALDALNGYSKDIWMAKAVYLDQSILEDDTAERAERWNALLGHLTWLTQYANR